jgi:hypothetical protein
MPARQRMQVSTRAAALQIANSRHGVRLEGRRTRGTTCSTLGRVNRHARVAGRVKAVTDLAPTSVTPLRDTSSLEPVWWPVAVGTATRTPARYSGREAKGSAPSDNVCSINDRPLFCRHKPRATRAKRTTDSRASCAFRYRRQRLRKSPAARRGRGNVDGLRLGPLPGPGRLPGWLAQAVQQQRGEHSEHENPGRDQSRIHERTRVGEL